MHSRIWIISLALSTGILTLSACGAVPGLPATPSPTSTLTPLPPTAPPTVTPSPHPTLTRTPSGLPTATNQPRITAGKTADVVGIWKAQVPDQAIRIEFRPDGTFDLDAITGPGTVYHIQDGVFRFAGGNLLLDADDCNNYKGPVAGYEYFHCQSTYKVYSTYRGEVPVVLSFVLVKDPFVERATWFDGRAFYPPKK